MDSPDAPDPEKTAQAQTGLNIGTAIASNSLNNVNQKSPYGTVKYNQLRNQQGKRIFDKITIGGKVYKVPRMQQNTKLSPEQQNLYDIGTDSQTDLAGIANTQINKIGGLLSSPLDLSGLPATGDRDYYTNAINDRLNEQFAKDDEALRTRLAAQGLNSPEGEAYRNEMQNFGDTKTRARTDAILAGGDYAAQEDQRRNQALNELLTTRNQPINEITALMSGSQVQAPQAYNPAQAGINSPDYMGMVSSNYAQQMADARAKMSGLFSLGGDIFSDERLKEDIKRVGETDEGLDVYTYKYKFDPTKTTHMGIMAQDLELVHPEAVGEVAGFKTVDYSRI